MADYHISDQCIHRLQVRPIESSITKNLQYHRGTQSLMLSFGRFELHLVGRLCRGEGLEAFRD